MVAHGAILEALDGMGVVGSLGGYIRTFLRDRTLRVRVGQATSSVRDIRSGVPQGSVLSLRYPVEVAVYADDVALWTHGPTKYCHTVKRCLKDALRTVAVFLESHGLQLSEAKTQALMLHPGRCRARRATPPITRNGRPLPWRLTVQYLGLLIAFRLTWRPAGKALRELEIDQRRSIRLCLGLRSTSPVAGTYTEAGTWPIDMRPWQTGLRHIQRLMTPRDGAALLQRFHSRPNSNMGVLFTIFGRRGGPADHHDPPRGPQKVDHTNPGHLHEAATLLQDELRSYLNLFTDGSVKPSTGAVILTDSRTALLRLHAADQPINSSGYPERSLAVKLHTVASRGCDVRLQWRPGHSGIRGNEDVTAFDEASTALARMVKAMHPDLRVVSGLAPEPLPARIRGDARCLLLRMRLDCCIMAERLHRHGRQNFPKCGDCPEPETLEHPLCSPPPGESESRAPPSAPASRPAQRVHGGPCVPEGA
ncbi:uncharacterized protein LOC144146710 [Haemaphysalis longicornis]